MAKAINVPNIQLLDNTDDQTSLGQRWTTWMKNFNYFKQDQVLRTKQKQRELLLHMLDPSVQELFEMLPERGETNDYDKAVQCLHAYLKPMASVP